MNTLDPCRRTLDAYSCGRVVDPLIYRGLTVQVREMIGDDQPAYAFTATLTCGAIITAPSEESLREILDAILDERGG